MMTSEGVFIRYVGRLFVVRFLGLLVFLVIVLQMLDFLNESDAIMNAAGATSQSAFRYISYRAPQIVSQFTPFAALLAIVFTLSQLNLSSEIVIMRAAGMSIHRVLRPIGVACLFIAAAHFLFHELIVVKSNARLAYWSANHYAVDTEIDATTRTDVRLVYEDAIISAASAARTSDGVRLTDLVIYALDKDGLATTATEAKSAVYKDGVWRLNDVRRAGGPRHKSDIWETTLNPELLFAISLNPDRTSLPTLVRQIGQLKADGVNVSSSITSLLSRFSRPLATLIMPLLGAIAGFGVSRQGNQLMRAAIGGLLGFSYFVAENLMLAIGKLGAVPPMLGAFFPFALFLIVGFAILLAMEN